MLLQIVTVTECLVTFGAGIWLLSRMGPFMCLKIPNLIECHVACRTFKWLLSCVGSFMCLQTGTHTKCLVTFHAGKWLLTIVNLLCHELIDRSVRLDLKLPRPKYLCNVQVSYMYC